MNIVLVWCQVDDSQLEACLLEAVALGVATSRPALLTFAMHLFVGPFLAAAATAANDDTAEGTTINAAAEVVDDVSGNLGAGERDGAPLRAALDEDSAPPALEAAVSRALESLTAGSLGGGPHAPQALLTQVGFSDTRATL